MVTSWNVDTVEQLLDNLCIERNESDYNHRKTLLTGAFDQAIGIFRTDAAQFPGADWRHNGGAFISLLLRTIVLPLCKIQNLTDRYTRQDDVEKHELLEKIVTALFKIWASREAEYIKSLPVLNAEQCNQVDLNHVLAKYRLIGGIEHWTPTYGNSRTIWKQWDTICGIETEQDENSFLNTEAAARSPSQSNRGEIQFSSAPTITLDGSWTIKGFGSKRIDNHAPVAREAPYHTLVKITHINEGQPRSDTARMTVTAFKYNDVNEITLESLRARIRPKIDSIGYLGTNFALLYHDDVFGALRIQYDDELEATLWKVDGCAKNIVEYFICREALVGRIQSLLQLDSCAKSRMHVCFLTIGSAPTRSEQCMEGIPIREQGFFVSRGPIRDLRKGVGLRCIIQ